MIKVRRRVEFVHRDHGRLAVAADVPRITTVTPGRVPRVSKLMALAIHFDQLLRAGKVRDLSELARLAHVTQPRMTQIMNLNRLAPDIQEELLFIPPVNSGRDAIHERHLRPIVGCANWDVQRRKWATQRAKINTVKKSSNSTLPYQYS